MRFVGPPPPTNVSVRHINQTVMSITWTPIDVTIAQGKIIHYIIRYTPQRSTRQIQINKNFVIVPANQHELTVSDLQPGISYIVTVSAATSVGEGSSSQPFVRLVPPLTGKLSYLICFS